VTLGARTVGLCGLASGRVGEGAKWQLVGTALAVALAVFGAVRLLGDRAAAGGEPVRIAGPAGAAGSASGPESEGGGTRRAGAAGPLLFVHVAGAVRRPGVYRLPADARAAAAVRRAGGATPRADLAAINLAAPLEDGQQVVVPLRVPGAAAAGGTGAEDAPLSLATATAEELEELDGIGETIAERIIEYRDEQGGLRSIDQLGEVDGIGETRLEALKEALRP